MKKSILLFTILSFTSCEESKLQTLEIKSGVLQRLPFTGNYILGTDSTFVIFNRESGQVLTTIHRNGTSK